MTIITILYPIIITVSIIYGIIKIDSHLVLVEKKVVLLNLPDSIPPEYNPISNEPYSPKYLYIHYYNWTRVTFYIEQSGNKIKYKRYYDGIGSYWYQKSKHKRFVSQEKQQFYIDPQMKPSKSFPVIGNIRWGDDYYSFFSLNNPHKNFQYYFDIYKFIQYKYNWWALAFTILYAFLIGWILNFFGESSSRLLDNSYAIGAFYIFILVFI